MAPAHPFAVPELDTLDFVEQDVERSLTERERARLAEQDRTIAEFLALADKIKAARADGRPAAPPARAAVPAPVASAAVPTLADVWKMFVELAGPDLKDLRSEEGRMRHVLAFRPQDGGPTLGEMPATAASKLIVKLYQRKRAKETTMAGKPTKPATRNREIAMWRRTLNWAADDVEIIPSNPIAHIELEKENNRRKTALREDALDLLLEAAEPYLDGMMPAYILTLYDSGMRELEGLRLRWDQVDLETGVVELEASETKTDTERYPRLLPRTLEAIRELPRHPTSPYVFARPAKAGRRSPYKKQLEGKPYHPRYVLKRFKQAVAEAGLVGKNGEPITIHTLRHSFVSNTQRRNIPIRVAMALSGHKTEEAFSRYNHFDELDVADAVRKMDEATRAERAAFLERREADRRVLSDRRGPKRTTPSTGRRIPNAAVSKPRLKP
jgi:integrase